MALCKIMICSYLDKEHYEGYDDCDLRNGIDFAEWLKEEGFEKEPFYEFDLDDFISWCRKEIDVR